MMKKLGILFLSVVMILFMANVGMAGDAGWFWQQQNHDMVKYFENYPDEGQGWSKVPEGEVPLNGVEANVEGKAEHSVYKNYGDNSIGGFGVNNGFSMYDGVVKFDENLYDAENRICGVANHDGDFQYNPNGYYNPGEPNCLGCDVGDGPGINSWDQASPLSNHLLNQKIVNHNSVTNDLETDASFEGENSGNDLTEGELRTEGKIELSTWSNTEDGASTWASGSQNLIGEYEVENTSPSLGDEVSGELHGEGGTTTFASRANGGDHRSALAGAQTGNELAGDNKYEGVSASGGDKEYGIHGSGYVSGNAYNTYGGSFAQGHFEAGYSYDVNTGNVRGIDADAGAEGVTTTSIDHTSNSMSVEVHTKSGAHSCPTAK